MGIVYQQVNTNGYVEFGADFLGRQPKPWNSIMNEGLYSKAASEGLAIVAPLWLDNDAIYGEVYYHVYDHNDVYTPSLAAATTAVIEQASRDALQFASLSDFTPTQVIVVTSANQLPRVRYDPLYDSVSTRSLHILSTSAVFCPCILMLKNRVHVF